MYFGKAAAAYKHMLEVLEDDPKFKENPEGLTAVPPATGRLRSPGGNFDDAFALIADVLKQKPMLLPAQLQAAETLQARGASDPKSYGLAILGAQPGRDGRNAIWGWAKLSNLTMNNEKFADTFHHARLSLVEARYRYALTENDAAKLRRHSCSRQAGSVDHVQASSRVGRRGNVRPLRTAAQADSKRLGEKESGLQEFRDRNAASTADATQQ